MKKIPKANISPEKIIDILLLEYDTMRAEELNCITGVITISTVAVTTLITALGLIYQTGLTFFYTLLPPIIIIFFIIYLNQQWSIFYYARYLRAIEDYVNEIAGLDLMIWETKVGSQFWEGRTVVKNLRTGKHTFNYYPITTAAILLVILGIFIYSLWQSSLYILSRQPAHPYLVGIWVCINSLIIILLPVARLAALPKFLDVVDFEIRRSFNLVEEDPLKDHGTLEIGGSNREKSEK